MSEAVDESSPWERDDVPVRDEPLAIAWDEPDEPEAVVDDATSPGRPWLILVGAMAAVMVVGAAVVLWPSDDRSGDASETSPTLDSLPSVDTQPIEESADDASDEDPESPADSLGDGAAGGDDGSPRRLSDGLPAAVAAIDTPTEIVMQTTDGTVHTLSLPSGTVRTVDLGLADSFGGNIVTSPDATMIGAYDRGTYVVPRSGAPLQLSADDFETESDPVQRLQINPYGFVENDDGSTSFTVATFGTGRDARTDFFVDPDGTIRPDPMSFGLSEPVLVWGERIVHDAGGVYRIEGTDAVRISPGRVIGSSDTELVIRTCEPDLACATQITDLNGENPRPFDLPDISQGFGLSLSPDATAVTFTDYEPSGTVQEIREFDGSTTRVPSGGAGGAVWTRDGSGLFVAGAQGGLTYVDRTADEAVATDFAPELGLVISIGIRFPDAELDDTRATSDTTFTLPLTPASPIGIEVAVLSDLGSLSVLDFDEFTAVTWATPRIPGTATPRVFDVGDELLVMSGTGSVVLTATPGDAVDISDTVEFEPPFAPGPDGATIWARLPDRPGAIDQTLHAPTSPETLPSDPISVSVVDGTVLGDDGSGALVLDTGGGVYLADGSAITRLTTGDLLAVSASAALVRECDERLDCSVLRVDRTTGERTDIDPPTEFLVGADGDRAVSLSGSLSPDGRIALLHTRVGSDGDVTEAWWMVDLVTGENTAIGEPDRGQPILWNDASTHAVFVTDGRLVVFEAATASIIDVAFAGDIAAIAPTDGEFGSG